MNPGLNLGLNLRLKINSLRTLASTIISAILLTAASGAFAEQRVVSIDGSITETIFALGAEQNIVGVDTTSVYPVAAHKLPKVGYMRQLSAEGILSLAPQTVLASKDAGPEKVLSTLKQAGLDIEIIPSERSLEGVFAKVQAIAEQLDKKPEAQQLIANIKQQSAAVQQQIEQADKRPRVMFLLAMGDRGASVAGMNTQADAMIKLMGADNVITSFSSYKALTPEAAIEAAPDVIVIAERPDLPLDLDQYPALKLTPAYQQERVVRAGSMFLLGFGPRIGEAMAFLAESFYPKAQSNAAN